MATFALSSPSRPVAAQEKALHVVHGVLSLELGGLERLVVDLVRAGRQRDYRVSVVCVERPGRLATQVRAAGAEVCSLDKPPGRSSTAIAQASRLLRSLQPDLIHTHQVGALWYLGQAARLCNRLPVLHTEHSDHVALARSWLAKLRARVLWWQAAHFADRFCCVSEDVARSVRRWGTVSSSKVDIVPNGINLARHAMSESALAVRESLGIPAGALVVGTLGRLVEVKRQDLLIRAFSTLGRQGRHAGTWLLVVGDGPQRQPLEALARHLGVSGRTVFAGYQPQPERLLKAMDLFVLTSRHEGLPLALLEAWAAGLPVISSAVGAIPQTVLHGINGMLFPSGDWKRLAELLDLLLNAPWTMSALGRQGKSRVEFRYSLERMADDYESRYRKLAGRKQGGSAL
jgi:glycosyltransferase involved in cell wall biosynthesis